MLDVSVNTNSFSVQRSVIASAALTRDRVLHFLSRKKKFYSLNFHVIDIKHLFQCKRLLYYLEVIFYLTRGVIYNTNISNMAAIILLQMKKWHWGRLSQISRGKLSQVLCLCVCVCVRARACVCYNTILVYTIQHRKLCTCMFIFKENVWVFSNIFDR